MSIIEQIEKAQRAQRLTEALESEAQMRVQRRIEEANKQAEITRQREETLEQFQEQKRLSEARRLSAQILQETDILRSLQEIEKNKITAKRHGIAMSVYRASHLYLYSYECRVRLAWGEQFTIKQNIGGGSEIIEAHFWGDIFRNVEMSYHFIDVTINLNSSELRITGENEHNLTHQQWKTHPDLINNALVETYLKPGFYIRPPSPSFGGYPSGAGDGQNSGQ